MIEYPESPELGNKVRESGPECQDGRVRPSFALKVLTGSLSHRLPPGATCLSHAVTAPGQPALHVVSGIRESVDRVNSA